MRKTDHSPSRLMFEAKRTTKPQKRKTEEPPATSKPSAFERVPYRAPRALAGTHSCYQGCADDHATPRLPNGRQLVGHHRRTRHQQVSAQAFGAQELPRTQSAPRVRRVQTYKPHLPVGVRCRSNVTAAPLLSRLLARTDGTGTSQLALFVIGMPSAERDCP
ncbi:hypothetical protein NDU88_005239 [Pleurodeles waltl]|uniref:Uncharacterized protein n=1 Tax=Pleurodeles waltl TaxID=8319 RepID=A0AAV7SL89_PLEWA|nr:hypothetical protein NDU88_005239 [Pleurodeles waltl]